MRSNKNRYGAEERVLLALAGNRPLADELPSCELEKLVGLAALHKVTAPLASAILAQGVASADAVRWATIALMTAERESRLYESCLRRIRDLFAGAGLPTIVLKGRSLSLGRSRDIGDIDILVPERDLLGSIRLLESAGYAYVGHLRNRWIRSSERGNWPELMKWANQFEFKDPVTDALIELHTSFFERRRVYLESLDALNGAMERIAASCEADAETGCLFLSMEDRVLLLSLHAGIKRAPYRRDFVLRHILDLDALIEAGFSWDAVIDRAEGCRVLHHLYFLMLAYAELGGRAIPHSAVRSAAERLGPMEKRIVGLHLRCSRGLYRESYGAAFLYRLLSPFVLPSSLRTKARSLLLLPIALPEPWRIEEIYGLPPESGYRYMLYLLEPFRWCRLAIEKLKKRRGHGQRVRRTAGLDRHPQRRFRG